MAQVLLQNVLFLVQCNSLAKGFSFFCKAYTSRLAGCAQLKLGLQKTYCSEKKKVIVDEEFKSSDKYFGVPIEKQRRAVRLYRI